MIAQTSAQRRTSGFTLVEIVVALGIFMVLGILSYRALASIIDSRDRVGAEQQRWLAVTRFMQRLEIDLQQVPLELRDAVVYDADRQTLRLIRLIPNTVGDEVRTIRYRWRDGRVERDQRKLIPPASLIDHDDWVDPELVLESVQTFEWLWSVPKSGSGAELVWQAPPKSSGDLPPAAIRLRLKLTDLPGDLLRVLVLR